MDAVGGGGFVRASCGCGVRSGETQLVAVVSQGEVERFETRQELGNVGSAVVGEG